MTRLLSSPILLLVAGAAVTLGQTFDAASVKPYDTASHARHAIQGGPGTGDPGRFLCRNCPLIKLVTIAYDVKSWQVFIDIRRERYDVEAKVPPGATREQFRHMLQDLLADRFRLTLHHERKQMAVYRLSVAKNGPKLTRSPVAGSNELEHNDVPFRYDKDGYPDLPPGAGAYTTEQLDGTYHMGATNVTMNRLADVLATFLARPVYDATGLDGEYDFKLLWSQEMPNRLHQDGSPASAEPGGSSARRPSLRRFRTNSDSGWSHPPGRSMFW